jgi:hypothetical protein
VLKGSILVSNIELRRGTIIIPGNKLIGYKLNTLIASKA